MTLTMLAMLSLQLETDTARVPCHTMHMQADAGRHLGAFLRYLSNIHVV